MISRYLNVIILVKRISLRSIVYETHESIIEDEERHYKKTLNGQHASYFSLIVKFLFGD